MAATESTSRALPIHASSAAPLLAGTVLGFLLPPHFEPFRRSDFAAGFTFIFVAAGVGAGGAAAEVRFSGGREPMFFYWDDLPSRRLRPDILTGEEALERAKAFARAERDKLL